MSKEEKRAAETVKAFPKLDKEKAKADAALKKTETELNKYSDILKKYGSQGAASAFVQVDKLTPEIEAIVAFARKQVDRLQTYKLELQSFTQSIVGYTEKLNLQIATDPKVPFAKLELATVLNGFKTKFEKETAEAQKNLAAQKALKPPQQDQIDFYTAQINDFTELSKMYTDLSNSFEKSYLVAQKAVEEQEKLEAMKEEERKKALALIPKDAELVRRNTETNKDSDTKDLDNEKEALKEYLNLVPSLNELIGDVDAYFLKLDNIFNNYEDLVEKYPSVKPKIEKYMVATTTQQKATEKLLENVAYLLKQFKADLEFAKGEWASTQAYKIGAFQVSEYKSAVDAAKKEEHHTKKAELLISDFS